MEFGAESLAFQPGQAAFSAKKKNRPYLARTLRKAFRQMMGSAASSQHGPKESSSSSSRVEIDNMDSPDTRPTKRQKLTRTPRRVKSRQNLALSSDSSASHMITSSGGGAPWRFDDVLVFPRPQPSGESLRVDVLQIVDDRPSNRLQSHVQRHLSDSVEIQCTLVISAPIIEECRGQQIRKEEGFKIQLSSLGTIKRIFNEAGQPTLRVILDKGPFVIPVRDFFVNKPPSSSRPASYGLSDHYDLEIWLDPIGVATCSSNWPPFDSSSKTQGSSTSYSNQRIICSKSLFEMIDDSPNQKLDLGSEGQGSNEIIWHQHSLRFDIRYAFPIRLRTSSRRAIPIPGEFEHNDVTLIYSRCVRQFDGTESIRQDDITGRGFFCAMCMTTQPSWDFFRFHITTEHRQFGVTFNRSDVDQDVYFVELSNMDEAIRMSRIRDEASRELQLGPLQRDFNLENYISGDDTWVKSRRGPRDRPGNKRVSSSVSSVQESLRSTPITSVDLDFDNSIPKPRNRRRLVVPNIKQRLFHSTYKYELHPGDELSDDDDDLKYNWQIARHKDVIHDFTDLTDDEKDYIVQWDTFMMRKKITSNRFFKPALIEFMTENKAWFGERRSRGMEFGKHAMTLVLREAIDQQCLKQCCAILGEAAQEYRDAMKSKNQRAKETPAESVWPPPGRGKMDCICGKAVFPSGSVICRGPDCKRKHFHQSCLQLDDAPKDFRCPNCRPPDATEAVTETPAKISSDIHFERPVSLPHDVSVESTPSAQRDLWSARFLPIRKTPPTTNNESVTRKVTPTVARKSGAMPSTSRPSNSPQVANYPNGLKSVNKSSGAGFVPRPVSTNVGLPRSSPPGIRPHTTPSFARATSGEVDTAAWSPAWKLQQSRSSKPQGMVTYRTYDQRISEFGLEKN